MAVLHLRNVERKSKINLSVETPIFLCVITLALFSLAKKKVLDSFMGLVQIGNLVIIYRHMSFAGFKMRGEEIMDIAQIGDLVYCTHGICV